MVNENPNRKDTTMTPTITARQAEYLAMIRRHVAIYGRTPTLSAICRSMGVSSRSVALYSVRRLVEAGMLRRANDRTSTRYWPVENCPACGQVMPPTRKGS